MEKILEILDNLGIEYSAGEIYGSNNRYDVPISQTERDERNHYDEVKKILIKNNTKFGLEVFNELKNNEDFIEAISNIDEYAYIDVEYRITLINLNLKGLSQEKIEDLQSDAKSKGFNVKIEDDNATLSFIDGFPNATKTSELIQKPSKKREPYLRTMTSEQAREYVKSLHDSHNILIYNESSNDKVVYKVVGELPKKELENGDHIYLPDKNSYLQYIVDGKTVSLADKGFFKKIIIKDRPLALGVEERVRAYDDVSKCRVKELIGKLNHNIINNEGYEVNGVTYYLNLEEARELQSGLNLYVEAPGDMSLVVDGDIGINSSNIGKYDGFLFDSKHDNEKTPNTIRSIGYFIHYNGTDCIETGKEKLDPSEPRANLESTDEIINTLRNVPIEDIKFSPDEKAIVRNSLDDFNQNLVESIRSSNKLRIC